jgi:hypothetical protein
MSDKDLLVVISEMLRKQDQQAEKLDQHSEILNQHTKILNQHTVLIKETNETLKHSIDISVQQFQQQQQFNEHFLNGLNQLNEGFSNSQQQQNNFNERFLNSQQQQNHFNERFLNKLDDIENALKK